MATSPVTITLNPSGTTASGIVRIEVAAPAEAKIVQVNFDSGDWEKCVKDEGIDRWVYTWDTKETSNRDHTVVARALL